MKLQDKSVSLSEFLGRSVQEKESAEDTQVLNG